jgi:ribosomal protein S13
MGPSSDLGHPEIDAAVNAAEVFSVAAHKFQLLSLYMQRTNRDMQKSLDRLTAIQTDLRTRQQQDLEELAALFEYNEIKHITRRKYRNQRLKWLRFFDP